MIFLKDRIFWKWIKYHTDNHQSEILKNVKTCKEYTILFEKTLESFKYKEIIPQKVVAVKTKSTFGY